MQIPEHLRQFDRSIALIVASGSKHGRLLLAHGGTIEDVYEYTEPKVSYSDNEGRFMTSGKAGTYAIGGVRDDLAEHQRIEYADTIAGAIKKIAAKVHIDELYLCAPRQTIALLEERLSPALKREVYGEIAANVAHEHPIRILERLSRVETVKHPYTDSASILRAHDYLSAAKSGASTLGHHNLDRVLVQAKWRETAVHH